MIPTMSAYEANRDLNRAMGLPWHKNFTHAQLIEWYFPNPEYHGSYHWNWTSKDEQRWSNTFRKWQKLIYEFNKRGGRVAYGTDDNYPVMPWGMTIFELAPDSNSYTAY